MENIFSYFDKIYCINLEERKDRWTNCQKQFIDLDICRKVERFNAVKFKDSALSSKANSQIGCTLSHYEIMKEVKKKNYSRVLVLEDDFLFTKSLEYLNIKLHKSICELPKKWDLFYFGSYFVKGYDYNPIEKYSENLVKVNTGFCTHALSYSLNGVIKILNNLKLETRKEIIDFSEEYEVIDWYLVKFFQKQNNCFAVNELICEQAAGFSDIEKCFFDYHDIFVRSYEQEKCNNL